MSTAADEPGTPARPDPPPASGVRLPWAAVPQELREQAERHLGSRVVEAVTQPGGFSPGAAARLRLASGQRAFAKAAGPEPNPGTPRLHQAESRITARLPAFAPVPRLLGSFERGGWVMLLFEDIDGRMPAQPWAPAELSRVLGALADLAEALTPAPAAAGAPAVAQRFGEALRGWRQLAAAGGGGDDLPGLDPWARRHLSRLAALEDSWEQAAAGSTLVHADVRADNLLLTDARVYVVDWPWACLAQPWFDLVCMLPSIAMQGGPPPEAICAAHPLTRAADPGAVTAVLAAIAGYFVYRERQPPPPGLPTVREFQRAQGRAALSWLRRRTRWR
jgi:aminoglycoside phosphotransferase (APT) family kinase protein